MEKPPENKIVKGFKEYNSKVNWLVFILISIFSAGGWIEVFGKYIKNLILNKKVS